MRAAELRDLLAAMPDDLLVTINGKHVEYLYRRFEHTGPGIQSTRKTCDCGHTHSHWTGEPHVAWPATLDLHTRHDTKGPPHPEPAVEYAGRWTKAMRAAIDKHSDDPDARGGDA